MARDGLRTKLRAAIRQSGPEPAHIAHADAQMDCNGHAVAVSIRVQPVHLDQHGELIQIEATARGRPVEEGGYLWRGELRLWDNEILMGWYAANDGSVRSKGTMYFVLHPHGINATGRWVGLSYDGNIVTGWSSMARTEAEARELVGELKEQHAAPSR